MFVTTTTQNQEVCLEKAIKYAKHKDSTPKFKNTKAKKISKVSFNELKCQTIIPFPQQIILVV